MQNAQDEVDVPVDKPRRGQRTHKIHVIPFSKWPLYMILLKISCVFLLTCTYFLATFSIESSYASHVIYAAHAVGTVKA